MNTKRNFNLCQIIICTACLALFAAFAIPKAQADVGPQSFGVTNFVTAQTGYTGAQYGSNVVSLKNAENVDIFYKGSGSAAGTSDITVWFLPVSDNSDTLVATNSPIKWSFAAAGATTVLYRTNFPASIVGSAGAFRLYHITNANASCNMTNQSLTAVTKKIR